MTGHGSERDARSRAATVAGGVILIAIGILFLAETIGIADFGDLIELYWPMILVLIGIPKLLSRETVGSGLWLIAIGVWLQISHLGLFGLGWSNSWPVLLILIGAGMVIRAIWEAAFPRTPDGGPHEA